jgi:hypothetical protein
VWTGVQFNKILAIILTLRRLEGLRESMRLRLRIIELFERFHTRQMRF